jgi:rare lipoprotein A
LEERTVPSSLRGLKSKKVLGLFFILAAVSCARVRSLPSPPVQTGLASWYGPDFHGKATSNKEIYNMYDFTAAHNTLPFGTNVMVTNLDNGKSVVVRINDRGPFVGNRVIDLSFAAARVLGMVGTGTAPVKIEVLGAVPPVPSSPACCVQVGSFVVKDNALALQRTLQEKYDGVYVSIFRTSYQTYFRVRIRAGDKNDAQRIAERVSAEGMPVIILEER